MHVTCTIENLPQYLECWRRAVHEVELGCYLAVKLGVQEAVQEALHARHWKDRTGDSKKKLRGVLTAAGNRGGDTYGAEGVFEAAFAHASYLDSGTEPHVIRAHGVALRWFDSGGSPVFAREVHHPGTKGDGFFGAGVKKCERVMQREVELSVPRAQRVLDT